MSGFFRFSADKSCFMSIFDDVVCCDLFLGVDDERKCYIDYVCCYDLVGDLIITLYFK